MRISIWQQFSSNHSANFTVVGTFATPAEAAKVASTIAAELKKIQDWYLDPANAEIVKKRHDDVNEQGKYTPPELDLIERYQLGDMMIPIDWIESDIENAVHVFENYVFVEPTTETWSGFPPFHQLVRMLGGQPVLVADESSASIRARVTCRTSDPDVVQKIREYGESVSLYSYPGDFSDLEYDGSTVQIKQIHGGDWHEVMPELIAWLKELGCTDIRYEFFVEGEKY